MRAFIKYPLYALLFLLWLAFSVVTGGLVLSVKDTLGINFFSATGYHAFEHCLKSEAEKAAHEKTAPHAPQNSEKPH